MRESELPFPPEIFIVVFVVVFPLLWIAAGRMIAEAGWRRIGALYPATSDPPSSARRMRFGSLSIGGSLASPNYNWCIDAWLSGAGLWLRPMRLFRLFHPMIFIPWDRMRSIERERILLFRRARIRLAGNAPDLLLYGALARAALAAHPSLSTRP